MSQNAKQIMQQRVMQQYGKTFALAAKLLTADSRQAATELYAFARTVDDWVDIESVLQTNKDKAQANIAGLKHDLQNGQSSIQNLLQTYQIPQQLPLAFLHAQQHDNNARTIATEAELIAYSYGVAGSIGAMMRPILGAPTNANIYAVSLGIAMQLTNIARDVVEDAARNRVYIPALFFDAPINVQQILQPNLVQKKIIFAAIQKLLLLADDYYDFAKNGYNDIPLRNRLSIITAAKMYQAIGQKITKNGEQDYWNGRVSIGILGKISVALKSVFSELFNIKNSTQNQKLNNNILQAVASYAVLK